MLWSWSRNFSGALETDIDFYPSTYTVFASNKGPVSETPFYAWPRSRINLVGTRFGSGTSDIQNRYVGNTDINNQLLTGPTKDIKNEFPTEQEGCRGIN